MPTSGFSKNFWFLIPISREGKPAFAPPANAHAIIDYFISGFTNKASSSNEPKERFWLIVRTSKFLVSLAIK